ncbi:hypothetical protein [Desulfovirgula thermocuniculi]|uniref:hypothetical protein n=1 Tax=Desulfovirgula thermocuniculi TaxID=348842 RepID=UPI0004269FFC|nr:hypothetical protein [Desulfovirgula thermocuniculi]
MRKKGSAFFLAVLLVLALARPACGVPAYPGAVELVQPDGAKFLARQWGDERAHGWETVDGYTIVKDEMSDYWYFARKAGDGRLVSSGIRADMPQLLSENYPKHLRPGRDTASQEWIIGEPVKLVGVVVRREAMEPNWELVTWTRICTLGDPLPSRCYLVRKSYALVMPEHTKLRPGWLYLIRGHRLEGGPGTRCGPYVSVERAVALLPAFRM